MTVTLSDDAQRLVCQLLEAGSFSSVQEAVETAIRAMTPLAPSEFDPGEMDQLIAEGEASIRSDGVIVASQVFADLRILSEAHRKQSDVG